MIKHFSYSYKMLAMDIVLGYWHFCHSHGHDVPACTFDQLRNILIQIERNDLLRILAQRDRRPCENDEFSDEDNEELSDEDNATYL